VWKFVQTKWRVGDSDLAGDITVDERKKPEFLTAKLVSSNLAFKDLAPLVGAAFFGLSMIGVIILATGFRPDLRSLLPDVKGVLTATGAPLVSGQATAEAGLFFCGATPSALGQLRQIGIDAQRIADTAARQLRGA